jgi:hypothetical protein
MSGHPQIYLTEFHKNNSENCFLDQENNKKQDLTIEDVINQSLKQGRTTIKIIGE